jgi:phosphatidylinositol phospholipase C delta
MDIYDGPEASKALDPDEKGIGALGGALKSTATVAAASPSPAANAAAPAKNVGDVDPGDVPGDWGAGIIPFDYTGIISTEPIVTHGGTLTTSLSARSICHAINRYAFVTSDYPVIISAEIHCSVRQQKILVCTTVCSLHFICFSLCFLLPSSILRVPLQTFFS